MKHFLLLSIILLFCNYSYAQQKKVGDYSYIISTKKIILKPGDTLRIPVVSSKYPELKKALCDTNLFFGETLDSVVKHNQDNPKRGIFEFSYEVTFVNKDVISLILDYGTSYAFLDYFQERLTLNIHTGTAYPISKEINAKGLKWICNNYRVVLKRHILNNINNRVLNEETNDPYHKGELIENANKLTSEKILSNYIFTPKGICFTSEDLSFPHVPKPERDWLIPYNKLKQYILPTAIVLKKWKR